MFSSESFKRYVWISNWKRTLKKRILLVSRSCAEKSAREFLFA
jgi:hypothetical protein